MRLFGVDPTVLFALIMGAGLLLFGYSPLVNHTLPVASPQALVEDSISFDLVQATNALERVEQIHASSDGVCTTESVMLVEAAQAAIRQALAKLERARGILETRNIK